MYSVERSDLKFELVFSYIDRVLCCYDIVTLIFWPFWNRIIQPDKCFHPSMWLIGGGVGDLHYSKDSFDDMVIGTTQNCASLTKFVQR